MATTLKVHSFYGGDLHKAWDEKILEDYAARRPGISIKYTSTAIYEGPVLLNALDEELKSPPDVIMGPVSGEALRGYIRAGAVADISEVWGAEGWQNDYPQNVIDMMSENGKQYFVPMAFQWNPMFYRTDVFSDLSIAIPQTWDDVLDAMDTIKAAGKRPVTQSSRGWIPPTARWFTMLNLRLNGFGFHRDLLAGRESWLDDRVRDVMEHWLSVFKLGGFGENLHELNYRAAYIEFVVNGEAAMYLLGEWLYEHMQPGWDQHIDFFRFPALHREHGQHAVVHYYGAYMPTNATEPQAALDFLQHLGSTGLQRRIVHEQKRAVMTSKIPDEELPVHRQKGRDYVRQSDKLYPLFEMSTFTHRMGLEALHQFATLAERWREETLVDDMLENLETVRQEELAPQH